MPAPGWLMQRAAQKRGRICSCAMWQMGTVRGMLQELQHIIERLHPTRKHNLPSHLTAQLQLVHPSGSPSTSGSCCMWMSMPCRRSISSTSWRCWREEQQLMRPKPAHLLRLRAAFSHSGAAMWQALLYSW